MSAPLVIVVADDDLLFSTQVAAAVAGCGHRARVVRTAAAFFEALRDGPDAAIVNLAASPMDTLGAIRGMKSDPLTRAIPVLGFCGHLDAARRDAAQDAGCDRVATNGEVSRNLSQLLAGLFAGDRRPPTVHRRPLAERPRP